MLGLWDYTLFEIRETGLKFRIKPYFKIGIEGLQDIPYRALLWSKKLV